MIPEQYAIMLADFISYMKEKGIIIDVLGIDNEENFNEGNITPKKHIQIIDKLRVLATEKGFKMPLIIGPERYQPMGDVTNCWMKLFWRKIGEIASIFMECITIRNIVKYLINWNLSCH